MTENLPAPIETAPIDLAADSGKAKAAVLEIAERFAQDHHAAMALSARVQKAVMAGCQVAGTHSTDPEAGLKGFQAAVLTFCEDMDWAAFNRKIIQEGGSI